MGLAKKNYHQRGVTIKVQYVFPFKDENEKTNTEMASLEALPVYSDLARVNMFKQISRKRFKGT